MNPNLQLFLKGTLRVLGILAIIGGFLLLLTWYTTIDFTAILNYLMYGFFGIVMTGMLILCFGVVFKSLWVGIMHRSDNILLFCPDKVQVGIHIVSNHYHPGGETTDGYTSFNHYFISLSDGKMYLSRKLRDEKDLKNSLDQLQASVRLPLAPDLQHAVAIGSPQQNDKPTHFTSRINDLRLEFLGFESFIDFGFKISCFRNEKLLWRRRI
jgi:hypothetical protein